MAEAIKELHIHVSTQSYHSMSAGSCLLRLKIPKRSKIDPNDTNPEATQDTFYWSKKSPPPRMSDKITMITLWSLIPLIWHGHDSCYKHRKASIWIWNLYNQSTMKSHGLKGDMLYLQLEHCIHFKLLEHSSRTGDLHSSSGLITSAKQHPHRNQKETSFISI